MTAAPPRRWQLIPRQLHRLLGRHVQGEYPDSPMIPRLGQIRVISCSCGMYWRVVR